MKADESKISAELVKIYLRHRLIYSIAGLTLGTICILGGMVLFLNGIAGATSWTASLFGFNSKITDAAPGSLLFIVGIFFVLITRHRIDVNFSSGGRSKNKSRKSDTKAKGRASGGGHSGDGGGGGGPFGRSMLMLRKQRDYD